VSVVTSEKYGVSREQLLLSDSRDGDDDRDHLSSVAVRMALAETEIVSETQKFLESNGVCLEAFEENAGKDSNFKMERSSSAMLVKNLVPHTTEDELRELFEKSGVVGRVVVPPNGITGKIKLTFDLMMCP
jgi:multiple RNA-binding domain-containing protein 1